MACLVQIVQKRKLHKRFEQENTAYQLD